MARKGASTTAQQQQPEQQQESGTEVAVQGPNGDILQAVQLKDDREQQESDTDMVQELLAGNYSEEIVDEVRHYGTPQWEQTESSLDPIEDIDVFYDYDFKLPPQVHDDYASAARDEIISLELMKRPVDPAIKAQIEQRRQLVEGRHAEDVRWMKHKAYYKGVAKVRAAKKHLEQLEAEEAEDAAAAAPPPPAAAAAAAGVKQQPRSSSSSKPHNRLAMYSEGELLEEVSDPSEWEQGWNDPSYANHPEVLQQLRSAFAGSLGLAYVSPQQQAEREAAAAAAVAAAAARQAQAAKLEAATQDFVAKHTPYQAYTPEYLGRQKRQQQLDAHRRHKQQAFWLTLGLAVGSNVVRWWSSRNGKQQQRRRRSSAAGGGGSRRSTRPPTPLMAVAE